MSDVTGGSVNSVVAAASSPMVSDCVRLVAAGASFTALTVMLTLPVGLTPCGPLAPSPMVTPTLVVPLKFGAESYVTAASALPTVVASPVMV